MIWVRLMGGLGNQMFQYAAGRRLAIVHDTALTLDCSWFEREGARATTRRAPALGCFSLPAATTSLSEATLSAWEYAAFRPLRSNFWRHAFRRRVTVMRSTGDGFDPGVLGAPGQTLLIGYWQSERYFQDVSEEVKGDFTFTDSTARAAAALLQLVEEFPSIAVHVRRGDYVTDDATAQLHGTATPAYFHEAVEIIAQRISSPRIFVFSDDIPWCREKLAFAYPTIFVEGLGPHPGAELMAMSRCGHQVISNSTFGWWGAWLNASPDKTVVAPKQWFRDAGVDSADVVPSRWVRL